MKKFFIVICLLLILILVINISNDTYAGKITKVKYDDLEIIV